MIGEFLRRITAALDTTGIPYMLTGSLASSIYGIARATNDVDIVIAPSREQLLAVVQLFQRLGLTVAQEAAIAALRNRTDFNVIDFAHGWKADLILRKDRAFSIAEFERRETYEVEGVRLTFAQPEDVLIAKMEWARIGNSERQLDDAAGILEMHGGRLDRDYIEQWVESLELRDQWEAVKTRVV